MKKTFTLFTIGTLLLIGASAFVSDTKNSTGMAGYTGAPSEQTCAACHSGGSTATKTISLSSNPSFTGGKYLPDSVYAITIDVSAAGFNNFGFGCEILNSSNANIGTMQNAGSGVKFLNAGARRNAVHSAIKAGTGSVSFTFEWKAPAAGAGDATFYACGNAVNANGNTNGDVAVPGGALLSLTEGTVAVVQPTFTAIQETTDKFISNVIVSPNPSSGFSQISYSLKKESLTEIELYDINGKKIKQLVKENEQVGYQSHIINLSSVPAGVYFVRVISDGNQVSQKLVSVN